MINKIIQARVDMLRILDGVEQDVKWHPEGNAAAHSEMAGHEAILWCAEFDIPKERAESICIASYLHDIGKSDTTITNEAGRIVSPGHDTRGTEIAKELGYSPAVCMLIRLHMLPCNLTRPTKRAVRKIIKKLSSVGLELIDLFIVVRSDIMSRSFASRDFPTSMYKVFELGQEILNEPEKEPDFVDGKFVMKYGFTEGPDIGKIKRKANELHQRWPIKSKYQCLRVAVAILKYEGELERTS